MIICENNGQINLENNSLLFSPISKVIHIGFHTPLFIRDLEMLVGGKAKIVQESSEASTKEDGGNKTQS